MRERTITPFIENISRYFETHPEAKTFLVDKTAMAYLCGTCLNSLEVICSGLSHETTSIKNLKGNGKIEVDRKGFVEWYNLKLEAAREKALADHELFYLNQEAFGPKREILYQKERVEQARKKIEELKKSVPEVKAEADRLEAEAREEAEKQKVPEEIEEEDLPEGLWRDEYGNLWNSDNELVEGS